MDETAAVYHDSYSKQYNIEQLGCPIDDPQITYLVTTYPCGVFFDFDGTLSEIVPHPEDAQLIDGGRLALEQLARYCPLGILSGRDSNDVARRVGVPGLWYGGSHGLDLIDPQGKRYYDARLQDFLPRISQLTLQLHRSLDNISGVFIEEKNFTVAVHYRHVDKTYIHNVCQTVEALGHAYDMHMISGRQVLELLPPVDRDKGQQLEWILTEVTRSSSMKLVPFFLGDDITDEAGFQIVENPTWDGVGIVIAHPENTHRLTKARFSLSSPHAVLAFIHWLITIISAR